MLPLSAWADIYAASAAAEKEDFPRAFELYRELAELGHVEAQENLAVMYVNGEGVKRDNVLGFAWAAIAKENGAGEAASGIVAQLEPHLNAAARGRIAEVQARFGKAALHERLLPAPPPAVPIPAAAHSCQMKIPANPDNFYPSEAKRQAISGSVLVEATVAPDGHARNARVWNSLPAGVFDEAGRRVALSNVYAAPRENGVAKSCTIRFRVRFRIGNGDAGGDADQRRILAEVREKAQAGDPRSQLTYGLLLEMRDDMNVAQERPLDWFVRAAQGGLAPAQYLVGMHTVAAVVWGGEKDVRKGLTWMQMAVDAGQPNAQAALADYLLRNGSGAPDAARAQELLEKAVASGHRDAKYYLSALLACGSDAEKRDPKRALELIEQVRGELDFDPTFFEIRAAANAQLGDFAGAQKDQKLALQRARKLGWDTKDVQARLANYEASKTWTGNLFAF
jgi:TonB family protein